MSYRSITVTVPIPRHCCNPNARCHWRRKAKDVAATRLDAKHAAMYAVAQLDDWTEYGMPWPDSTVRVRWYHATAKHRDRDNAIASLKATIDGIVDGGILADDDKLTWLPIEMHTDRDEPRVELIFTRNAAGW